MILTAPQALVNLFTVKPPPLAGMLQPLTSLVRSMKRFVFMFSVKFMFSQPNILMKLPFPFEGIRRRWAFLLIHVDSWPPIKVKKPTNGCYTEPKDRCRKKWWVQALISKLRNLTEGLTCIQALNVSRSSQKLWRGRQAGPQDGGEAGRDLLKLGRLKTGPGWRSTKAKSDDG